MLNIAAHKNLKFCMDNANFERLTTNQDLNEIQKYFGFCLFRKKKIKQKVTKYFKNQI
jgi:hypothetical protein